MTLQEAVATLRLIAEHPVEGAGNTACEGYVTADFFIDDEDQLDGLMAALHDLAEAASIVCAVIEDRWAGYRLGAPNLEVTT